MESRFMFAKSKKMDAGVERMRSFLLMTYHDLPNVLFMGSILFGCLMGYLPLVWVGLGLILNFFGIYLIQQFFKFLFKEGSEQIYAPHSLGCAVGYKVFRNLAGMGNNAKTPEVVAPSQWMGAASFFSIFCIYNSIRLLLRPATTGADSKLVDNRRAFSISALVIGLFFFGLVLMRGYTGCETILGAVSGVTIGGGLAVGFWHLLNACGAGRIPDILQVVGSLAPEGSGSKVPVLCAPATEEGFKTQELDSMNEEVGKEAACKEYAGLVARFSEMSAKYLGKSPENPTYQQEFAAADRNMSQAFAAYRAKYAGRFGLGEKPHEYCWKRDSKLLDTFTMAQNQLLQSGWTVGSA
jgi:hypothetical protein